MAIHVKGPPHGGVSADGPDVVVCLAANSVKIAPKSFPGQTDISRNPRAVDGSVISFSARHCRRSPVSRRVSVRISVGTGWGKPYGRSRAIRILEHDLPKLLAYAERLGARP